MARTERATRADTVQFTEEIRQLQLGAGDTFHGEGIPRSPRRCCNRAWPAWRLPGRAGVAPARRDGAGAALSRTLGVHVEACSNEASAAAMLGASIHHPLRGAVTWKSIVGTNVAADALSTSSPGVVGGALIVVGEDYGEGASVIQERTHAYALKSTLLLLDPRPDLGQMVRWSSTPSRSAEASNMPAMLELRASAPAMRGRFSPATTSRPISTRALIAEPAGFLTTCGSLAPAGDLPPRSSSSSSASRRRRPTSPSTGS